MIIEQVFIEEFAVWNTVILFFEIKHNNATFVIDVCVAYFSVSAGEIANLNIRSSYEIPQSQNVIHWRNITESYICEII